LLYSESTALRSVGSSDRYKNHDAQTLSVSDHDVLDHDIDFDHDGPDHVGDHHALTIMLRTAK